MTGRTLSKQKSAFQGNFSYHLLVWALLIIPTLFGSTYLLRVSFEAYMTTVLVRNGLLMAIVYINFLVLIPKLFRHKKYISFTLLTLVLIALVVMATAALDRYNYSLMNIKPLTSREMMQEMLFYVFNSCSYVVTAFLLFSLQEKQEQEKKLDEVRLEKLGAEIKYLRAQINPHFLFNTLNNIYGLALEKSEKTPEIIMKLSKIMDYMLYESNDVKVYLKKDIDNIRNYIDIERIRQGNNAEIIFDVRGDITDQVIVPLTLLPLVENAFKHGVNTIIKGAYMHVTIVVNGQDLDMDVKNNFKNLPEETERNGIGLTNLERRLDLFYPGDYSMKASAFHDDYHVKLKLRLS